MHDQRFDTLADQMLSYSLNLKSGDFFVIRSDLNGLPLVRALLKRTRLLGAIATVKLSDQEVSRLQLELLDPMDNGLSEAFLRKQADLGIREFDSMVGEIIIRAYPNDQELSRIDPAVSQLQARMMKPFRDLVVNHRRWVLFEYPTPGQAQRAGMSFEQYFNFALDACAIDYARMGDDMEPLRHRMELADQVRVTGPDTDLCFSIKDIPVIPCSGECNLPDGECFTAPVRDSANGTITFNAPSVFWGTRFEQIRLVFENGRIVQAEAGQQSEKLNRILDSDEGARYLGEFSFGLNPTIRDPFGNILFDEKIAGSIHLTPGACYDEAPNGNSSSVHWDLILIQRVEFGGGAVYFDDELIRMNGLFVPQDLQALNYNIELGGNK